MDPFLAHSQWFTHFDRSEELHAGSPVRDVELTRKLGFKRVAAHFVTLPPHTRSSQPHAESAEEEFVYVVSGRPQLWLNGLIYQLEAGHAVGFPAGTGIAHTLINNTDSAARLLVIGEMTKPDNRCAFPVNPELEKECAIWWSDPPRHQMGTHSGLPGPVRAEDWGGVVPDCVVHCPSQPRGKPFHYPGDNETFGHGFRLTDKIGLKALGIWYEVLPPHTRSAFPHAHTHEEELVFIVEGHPTGWLDGFARSMQPGDAVGFPPDTGVAHTIINHTDQDVVYICVGEAQSFAGEKISYPLNPLRAAECRRKGWLWSDSPRRAWGNESAWPLPRPREHLALRMAADRLDAALADRQSLIIELNSLPIGALQLEFRDEKPPICSISWQLNEVQRQSSAFVERCRSFIADFARRAYACESVEFVPDNSGLSPAKRSPRRLFDEAVATAHAEAESLGHSTYQDPTTGYQVFTRAALLARGYCCGSGCRHCPYSPMN